jgi:hypothetical protein
LNRHDAKTPRGNGQLGKNDSLDSILENRRVEIDEKGQLMSGGLQIGN